MECPDNCSMNGECDFNTGKCQCFDGFSGEKCNKKVCINNCSYNGKCVYGECLCQEGFTGSACEHSNIDNFNHKFYLYFFKNNYKLQKSVLKTAVIMENVEMEFASAIKDSKAQIAVKKLVLMTAIQMESVQRIENANAKKVKLR